MRVMEIVSIRFYAELSDLLPPRQRGRDIERPLGPGQTVKDLIEAMGVPHTEVDLVLVNGEPVDFARQLVSGDRISVYPVFEAMDVAAVSRVRPQPLRRTRFAADVHLGRLAGYLRLLGFDTAYGNDWDDTRLVECALVERRIILTRDRGLLKRSAVDHGYLVRETRPRAQLVEVIGRFDLRDCLRPLTRCAQCNAEIAPVSKTAVLESLPPRTAALVDEFWRCEGCLRVYWKGAHYRSLAALVALARGGG